MDRFKNIITIDQRAVVELDLKLDIIDLSIFDFIKDFANSKGCMKMHTDEGTYFWISHDYILKQMPLLKIKTTASVINRINNLVNAKLLVKHPRCAQIGKSLYDFGENYERLIFFDTPKNNFRDPLNNFEGINNITDNIESTHFVRTEEKQTNSKDWDLTFVRADYTPCVLEWLSHKRAIKKSYRTLSGVKKMYNNLVKLSNGSPEIAQMIVDQSIANNWDGLFALKGGGPTQSRMQQQELELIEKQRQSLERMAENERRKQNGGFEGAGTININDIL